MVRLLVVIIGIKKNIIERQTFNFWTIHTIFKAKFNTFEIYNNSFKLNRYLLKVWFGSRSMKFFFFLLFSFCSFVWG